MLFLGRITQLLPHEASFSGARRSASRRWRASRRLTPASRRTVASLFVAGWVAAGISWAASEPLAAEPRNPTFQSGVLIQFAVSDLARSVRFYRDVVGLEFELQIDELRWARFKTSNPGVILGLGESPEVHGSGTTSLNLSVSDVDAMRTLLEERGVEFLGPTKHIPGVVRLADFLDPDGNKIRLAGHPGESGE